MTKEEVFSFPSADGRTTVHAVRWTPEDGKYRAVLQIHMVWWNILNATGLLQNF